MVNLFFPFFITLFFYSIPPPNYGGIIIIIIIIIFIALDPFQSSTQNFPPEIPPPRWLDPGRSLVLTVEWSGYSRFLGLGLVWLLCLFLFSSFIIWSV